MRKPLSGTLRADGRWSFVLTGFHPKTGAKSKITITRKSRDEAEEIARHLAQHGREDWVPCAEWKKRQALTIPKSERRRYIYFVWTPTVEPPMVKVGIAHNLKSRLCALQIGSPVRLEVLYARAGSFKDESALHNALGSYWVHGEWFTLNDHLRKLIEDLRSNPDKSVTHFIG